MSNRITVSILFIFITMFISNFSYAEAPKESDLGYVPGELEGFRMNRLSLATRMNHGERNFSKA
jgi:hypothetical protein